MYLISVAVAAAEGFVLYSTRNVIRDLYYYMPTILWVFIGYDIERKQDNNELFRTLYCYGAMITFSCLLKLSFNFDLSSFNIKSIFGNYVSGVGIILAVLIYNVFVCKEVIFTVCVDRALIILMSIQIILSLERIAILESLIILSTAHTCYINIKIRRNRFLPEL